MEMKAEEKLETWTIMSDCLWWKSSASKMAVIPVLTSGLGFWEVVAEHHDHSVSSHKLNLHISYFSCALLWHPQNSVDI